jgi:mono/diheme cytochrome c family protein
MSWATKVPLFFLGSIMAIASCESRTPADAFADDPVALKRGKAIFTGTCGGYCHGTLPGPRDAPYLFDCVWIHGGSDEDIFATIANGVPNTAMVSFSGTLPEGDDDIWRIISFLKFARIAC